MTVPLLSLDFHVRAVVRVVHVFLDDPFEVQFQ